MLDNGPDGQGKCTKSFVSGDSAGGGLSLGVTLLIKDDGSQLPDAVISLCPWAELDPVSESYETNASNDPYISRDARIGKSHTEVNTSRGYGGHCFPKDVQAILATARAHNINLSLINESQKYNNTVRKEI